MPIVFTELKDTRDGSTDLAKDERRRRFYVGVPPDAALFQAELPTLGSDYPAGQATANPLSLDRFDVSDFGDGNSLVVAHYTADRSARIVAKPDSTHPDFKSWSSTWQETTSDYPTVMTFPMKVPGQPAFTGARGAETITYKIEETRIIYERRMVLTRVQAEEIDKISNQNGKLHKIKGKLYRFKASDLHQTEKTAWEVMYSYTFDGGTRQPAGYTYGRTGVQPLGPVDRPYFHVGPPADERTLYIPPWGGNACYNIEPGLNYPGLFVRDPFHVLTFVLRKDIIPDWFAVCPYAYEPEGWRQLPGDLAL